MATEPFSIVEAVAKETGYHFRKINDRVCKFLFSGERFKAIDVLVVWQGSLLVLGSVLASKYTGENARLAHELLVLNNNLDRVKVGVNQEGMLFVRVDVSIRTLDQQEFKENLDQIAAAADYVFGIIQAYDSLRGKQTPAASLPSRS
ncbi:MAG: hypothetical protein V1746_05860 [bacterium]